MQVSRIDECEFDTMQEEWNDLLSNSLSDNVFLRWEWIHTWWSVFRRQRTLYLLGVRRQGRLIGIAPFYLESAKCPGRTIAKLCSDELSPDYLDLIVHKEAESEVVSAIRGHIHATRGEWDILVLEHLRPDSILIRHLATFKGFNILMNHSHRCRYIRLEKDFEHYWQGQHALARFALMKKERVLQEEKHVIHRTVQTQDDLQEGFQHLFALHRKRASEAHVKSNFLSEDVQQFHLRLGRLFLPAGILNLHFLCAGQTPISAHYCFNYKKKIYFYQSGFDPLWNKWSLGMVQLLKAVRQAFEQGFEELDFLKGEEGYKVYWANAERIEEELRIYNHTFYGFVAWSIGVFERALRGIKHGLNGFRAASPNPRQQSFKVEIGHQRIDPYAPKPERV